jgi:hypothetical protein
MRPGALLRAHLGWSIEVDGGRRRQILDQDVRGSSALLLNWPDLVSGISDDKGGGFIAFPVTAGCFAPLFVLFNDLLYAEQVAQ